MIIRNPRCPDPSLSPYTPYFIYPVTICPYSFWILSFPPRHGDPHAPTVPPAPPSATASFLDALRGGGKNVSRLSTTPPRPPSTAARSTGLPGRAGEAEPSAARACGGYLGGPRRHGGGEGGTRRRGAGPTPGSWGAGVRGGLWKIGRHRR